MFSSTHRSLRGFADVGHQGLTRIGASMVGLDLATTFAAGATALTALIAGHLIAGMADSSLSPADARAGRWSSRRGFGALGARSVW
jgi:hypothetical protein